MRTRIFFNTFLNFMQREAQDEFFETRFSLYNLGWTGVQQAGPELTDIHPLAFGSQDLRLMACVTMSVLGNFTF